jgi:hypothetical protein
MYGGSPPTDLNARTGESTPPGITREARACSSCDLFRGFISINEYTPTKSGTTKDTKGHKEQIKLISPNDTGLVEKAWGGKANLITAEILKLRQIPLSSFVSFVINRFSGGDLPSYAALCRWLEKNCHDKIAPWLRPNGGQQHEADSLTFYRPDFQHGLCPAELTAT